MKKLKLVLDELRVQTFETVSRTDPRGTVVGQGDSSAGAHECWNQCYSEVECTSTRDACMPTLDYTCNCVSNEIACAPSDEGTCASCDAECTANGTC